MSKYTSTNNTLLTTASSLDDDYDDYHMPETGGIAANINHNQSSSVSTFMPALPPRAPARQQLQQEDDDYILSPRETTIRAPTNPQPPPRKALPTPPSRLDSFTTFRGNNSSSSNDFTGGIQSPSPPLPSPSLSSSNRQTPVAPPPIPSRKDFASPPSQTKKQCGGMEPPPPLRSVVQPPPTVNSAPVMLSPVPTTTTTTTKEVERNVKESSSIPPPPPPAPRPVEQTITSKPILPKKNVAYKKGVGVINSDNDSENSTPSPTTPNSCEPPTVKPAVNASPTTSSNCQFDIKNALSKLKPIGGRSNDPISSNSNAIKPADLKSSNNNVGTKPSDMTSSNSNVTKQVESTTDNIVKPADLKPSSSNVTRPTDLKPSIKPTDLKPSNSNVTKPTDLKPSIKPTDLKPPIKPTDLKPPIKPTDLKPSVKPTNLKPSNSNVTEPTDLKIADNNAVTKPADLTPPNITSIKPSDLKLSSSNITKQNDLSTPNSKIAVKPSDLKNAKNSALLIDKFNKTLEEPSNSNSSPSSDDVTEVSPKIPPKPKLLGLAGSQSKDDVLKTGDNSDAVPEISDTKDGLNKQQKKEEDVIKSTTNFNEKQEQATHDKTIKVNDTDKQSTLSRNLFPIEDIPKPALLKDKIPMLSPTAMEPPKQRLKGTEDPIVQSSGTRSPSVSSDSDIDLNMVVIPPPLEFTDDKESASSQVLPPPIPDRGKETTNSSIDGFSTDNFSAGSLTDNISCIRKDSPDVSAGQLETTADPIIKEEEASNDDKKTKKSAFSWFNKRKKSESGKSTTAQEESKSKKKEKQRKTSKASSSKSDKNDDAMDTSNIPEDIYDDILDIPAVTPNTVAATSDDLYVDVEEMKTPTPQTPNIKPNRKKSEAGKSATLQDDSKSKKKEKQKKNSKSSSKSDNNNESKGNSNNPKDVHKETEDMRVPAVPGLQAAQEELYDDVEEFSQGVQKSKEKLSLKDSSIPNIPALPEEENLPVLPPRSSIDSNKSSAKGDKKSKKTFNKEADNELSKSEDKNQSSKDPNAPIDEYDELDSIPTTTTNPKPPNKEDGKQNTKKKVELHKSLSALCQYQAKKMYGITRNISLGASTKPVVKKTATKEDPVSISEIEDEYEQLDNHQVESKGSSSVLTKTDKKIYKSQDNIIDEYEEHEVPNPDQPSRKQSLFSKIFTQVKRPETKSEVDKKQTEKSESKQILPPEDDYEEFPAVGSAPANTKPDKKIEMDVQLDEYEEFPMDTNVTDKAGTKQQEHQTAKSVFNFGKLRTGFDKMQSKLQDAFKSEKTTTEEELPTTSNQIDDMDEYEDIAPAISTARPLPKTQSNNSDSDEYNEFNDEFKKSLKLPNKPRPADFDQDEYDEFDTPPPIQQKGGTPTPNIPLRKNAPKIELPQIQPQVQPQVQPQIQPSEAACEDDYECLEAISAPSIKPKVNQEKTEESHSKSPNPIISLMTKNKVKKENETPLEKKRRKNLEAAKKKFAITGDETPVGDYSAKNVSLGIKKNFLKFNSGEKLTLIQLFEHESGQIIALIKNSLGEYGFCYPDDLEGDFSYLKTNVGKPQNTKPAGGANIVEDEYECF